MKYTIILFAVAVVLCSGCSKPAADAATSAANEGKAVQQQPASLDTQKKIDYDKQAQMKQVNYDKLKEAQVQQQPQSSVSSEFKEFYLSGTRKHNAGDFSGAISDFNKAIEINPQFGDAFGYRGMSKLKSGDKTGACSDWEKAQQLGYGRAPGLIDSYCK